MRLLSAVPICTLFLMDLAYSARTSGRVPSAEPTTAGQFSEIPSYPDSTSGLEHLVKDILKAQKENNATFANELLLSLVLPNYETWYRENFDEPTVDVSLPQYRANAKVISAQLAQFFLGMQNDSPQHIEAVRFEKDCDDNANERMFATLDGRLKVFPVYEVRFFKGEQFRRLFAFVYVDGKFRFLTAPDFTKAPIQYRRNVAQPQIVAQYVQAAKLVKRVQPVYPTLARGERLSGTVRLHVLIAKDGGVQNVRVMRGSCSLARASVDAVRQWRYTPTLLNGEPVDVDTEIDVIFQIHQ